MLAEYKSLLFLKGLDTIYIRMLAIGKEIGTHWFAKRRGLYHFTESGTSIRVEWARKILENDPRRTDESIKEIVPALSSIFLPQRNGHYFLP
jgi:hypothetical protein